ncbi:hypothetical protein CGMCC3_g6962 [Colletotrichum fructicola]|nr:uncharacterized protein CGMCC3_g6962 [Colletotrichum fructicola]KAE9577244.1 hypothetical protein CGMCC3_g6962 [Colletotrichum fructicola]
MTGPAVLATIPVYLITPTEDDSSDDDGDDDDGKVERSQDDHPVSQDPAAPVVNQGDGPFHEPFFTASTPAAIDQSHDPSRDLQNDLR